MLKRNFNHRAEHDFEIREQSGRYRKASEDEILETALLIINARFKKGTAITDPKKTHDFLKLELAHEEHELFAVMWQDNHHRIIAFETLFRGTIDGASVYPREVVKAALVMCQSFAGRGGNSGNGSGRGMGGRDTSWQQRSFKGQGQYQNQQKRGDKAKQRQEQKLRKRTDQNQGNGEQFRERNEQQIRRELNN